MIVFRRRPQPAAPSTSDVLPERLRRQRGAIHDTTIARLTIVVGFLLCLFVGRAIAQRIDGSGVRVNGASALLVSDGTISAPSISFASQPSLGFFKSATNGIGISGSSGTSFTIMVNSTSVNINGSAGASAGLTIGSGSNQNAWTFAGTGNFLAGSDNIFDIGLSGANRPRNLFLSNSLSIGPNLVFSAAVPTITSGFGTTPSIVGTAYGFRLTLGNPVGQTGVVAFNTTFVNPPVVQCGDETSIAGDPIKETPTATNVTLTTTIAVAGDKIACSVTGF
jgi:hypothetical protein